MKFHYPATGRTTKLKNAGTWCGIVVMMGMVTALSLVVFTVWLVIIFG
jgi:hypothetical protein